MRMLFLTLETTAKHFWTVPIVLNSGIEVCAETHLIDGGGGVVYRRECKQFTIMHIRNDKLLS